MKTYSKSLPKESFLRKSIFKNPLESNIGTRGILVAVLLSFIIPIGLMIVFNDYSIVFNGIALLVFFIGYGFYKAFNEKKEFVSAKEVAYEEVERLVSIGWNREVAIKKIFSENSKESLANPLKEVQTNVEKSLKQKEKEKTNYSLMLRTKTNLSVLVAGTDVPCNPLKLRKTSFSRFARYFTLLFAKVRKVSYSIEDLKWEYGINDKEPNQRPCE